ncbi:DddA-like double-stranded DNA deaminase toxin [Amycolatopsis sp. NPDC051071]|uniref:DddA-like double-stranded DNA deaminase toxin n=1 Tax=Amycolatopsis sp. NPDC051071 TaxID=3154637 RepID=UPI0034402DB5
MSDIEAVAAALGAAITSLEQAEQATQEAAGGFGESASHLGQAVYGTADPEIGALPELYDELRRSAEQAVSHFRTVKANISAYLDTIGVSVAPANNEVTRPKWENRARVRPGVHTTGHEAVAPAHERAEALRQELPPPIKPGELGRKTHGRWFAGSGQDVTPIVSGRDEMAAEAQRRLEALDIPGMPSAVADVETKLAAHMAASGITNASVVINYAPCRGIYGCETLVTALLPEGSALTVYGIAPDGTETEETFQGGATPWWK